ncbi:MAG: enolase C-terminal domain-like protein [Candidatus Dormibacteria bacterium]
MPADGTHVRSLDVAVYTIPTEQPEADGTLQWDSVSLVVVEPQTDSGVRGLGYAIGDTAVAEVVKSKLRDQVLGVDVRDTTKAWERMRDSIRNLGRPGIASMAIAAVDIALWDTKARVLEQPLHRVLGAIRDSVPVYGSGGFTSYTVGTLVEQLSGWVESGIPRVKMKIGMDWGRSWRQDIERVRAVRRAIGDDAELFVDANGAYDRTQARRLGTLFAEELGVSWFEEPVTSDDLDGLARLREQLPLDVTAGEYGYHLEYFRDMLHAGSVDVLQADIGRCAGVTEWLRVAATAAAMKTPYSAHCGPSIHVHAATVPPNLRHIEYFHTHVRADHILFDGVLDPVDGALHPADDRPGIGLTLKRSDAERYRVA